MNKFLLTFLLLLNFCFVVFGQTQNEQAYQILDERGEVCFSFTENDQLKINELSKIISLDRKEENRWVAYANKTEFSNFLEKGYSYKLFPRVYAKSNHVAMAATVAEMENWDKYPTYAVYLQMMHNFAQNYPNSCRIDTIGFSVENRLILVAEISSNIKENTAKPQFFYSASMHGDELTGYVLTLRLIDYLLKNYNHLGNITSLLNDVQICINPLSNPDGTYRESNADVSEATRYNSNNIDLNRNFPNPFGNNSGLSIQKENQAMINYLGRKSFTLSANLHGGAEVMNYPWDMFNSSEKTAADNIWWQLIARNYVDTCRKIKPNAFSDVVDNGVVDGGDWYKIDNGRQDYVNAYFKCREMTMEISSEKMLDSDSLNVYWTMQHKSLLNYITQTRYGIRGYVVDSVTLAPIKAKIFILNHDKDSSHVYSFLPFGNFYRPIKSGNYSATISAPGYISRTIDNIQANDFGIKNLDTVKLLQGKDVGIISLAKTQDKSSILFLKGGIQVTASKAITDIEIFDLSGRLFFSKKYGNSIFSLNVDLPKNISNFFLIKIAFEDHSFDFFKAISIDSM